jgi:hypothetical protein
MAIGAAAGAAAVCVSMPFDVSPRGAWFAPGLLGFGRTGGMS